MLRILASVIFIQSHIDLFFSVPFSFSYQFFCKIFDDNQVLYVCYNKFSNKRISRIGSTTLQNKYEMSVLNSFDRIHKMSRETVSPEGKLKFDYHILCYTRWQPDILNNHISEILTTTKRHRLSIIKLVLISTFLSEVFPNRKC